MIRLIVNGACGRMGREVVNLALRDRDFSIQGLFEDKKSPLLGKNIRELFGGSAPDLEITRQNEEILAKTDVVIDFSLPEATLSLLRIFTGTGPNLVIGTTGFNESEMAVIRSLSNSHAILHSPNLSEGINKLFAFLPELLILLGRDWDSEIVEFHHRNKIDAPSGTALRLGEIVAESRGTQLGKIAHFGRKGGVGPRPDEEICFHSIRGGGTPGEHSLVLSKGDEEIVITHRIHNRRQFARGALLAAKKMAGLKPGMYTLNDLIENSQISTEKNQ
jgi:4-hydroxy-tetrahydrodipicolinate reductase